MNLDYREGLLSGGESGPALVPGKPDESLLIRALQHDGIEMPPSGPLPEVIVNDFKKWIAMGAVDPRTEMGKASPVKTLDGEALWSFMPRKNPAIPKVQQPDWPRVPFDAFVLAEIERSGLQPTRDAQPRDLIRRLYLDLIGLPPTFDQIETFVREYEALGGRAVVELVDSLLDNEQFGVRWGRHWLDIARYGESNGDDGLGRNATFPHAWRYRDYVINAFNADIPYDRFITEQIAGDLLPADSAAERNRLLTATGFLAIGAKPAAAMNNNFAMDVVDDQINAIGTGVLGLSIACARCHDHKHDPIPTRDYYALAGIFSSTETMWGAAGKEKLTAPPTPLHEMLDQLPSSPAQPIDRSQPPVFPASYQETVNQLKPLAHSVFDQAAAHFSVKGNIEYTAGTYAKVKDTTLVGKLEKPLSKYSISLWFKNSLKNDARPITAYLFSHAAMGDKGLPGDHLGIGGTHDDDRSGKLFVFNGNGDKKKSVGGYSVIPTNSWNHVVFIRDDQQVRVYLNGRLEIDEAVPSTFGESLDYCLANRSDNFAPLDGNLAAFTLYDRPLSQDEVGQLQQASGQPLGPAPTRPFGFAMGVRDKAKVANTKIHIDGDGGKLGPEVPRGVLTAYQQVGHPSATAWQSLAFGEKESGRLTLAQWLTDPAHPQTARVYVNRIWLHLMGRPIVSTPDDFGVYGARPSHPDLLDHLAETLVRDGWSTKRFIRMLVLSRTYQLDHRCDASLREKDPENNLFARHARQRMDAEVYRDSVLYTAGRIDLSPGPRSAIAEVDALINWPPGAAVSLHRPSQHRSIYLCMMRNSPPPDLAAFDLPDGLTIVGQRPRTTLPTQTLFLLNSPLLVDSATSLAEQMIQQYPDDLSQRVQQLFIRVLSRRASEKELALALQLIQRLDEQLASEITDPERRQLRAWAGLCQSLLVTNEFLFID